MADALTVWWSDRVVGRLAIDKHGDMAFTYAQAWLDDADARPLSVSLPKRLAPFRRRESRPFFDGLLPEEAQREAIAAATGISSGNEYRLLEALGGEVAGALVLWPEGDPPPESGQNFAPTPLTEHELVAVLDRLPRRPMLVGDRGLRLSLAGAQSKLPVVVVDDQPALPATGQPTTHIIKPPIERFEETTENEAFAMRLAARLGLDVAPAEPRRVGKRLYLLVKRYDREDAIGGGVRRLHQEDFCQALGVFPERKYAAEGGPIVRDCFELVRRVCTRPALEVLKLLDAVIYNVLIGNADAHGKNFSLLYRTATTELAPLYDLLSTVAYPELAPKFAMKVARRSTLEELKPGDWTAFAKEVGLGAPYVRRRVAELASSALRLADTVSEELIDTVGQAAAFEQNAQRVCKRAERLAITS